MKLLLVNMLLLFTFGWTFTVKGVERNDFGQLGNGNIGYRTPATNMISENSNILQVAASQRNRNYRCICWIFIFVYYQRWLHVCCWIQWKWSTWRRNNSKVKTELISFHSTALLRISNMFPLIFTPLFY
jgi:hypothetical protein